jgi:hypothetical protein
MHCSGCGKEISFFGSVCPYCHRDKSDDKAFMLYAIVLVPVGCIIGALAFGIWGGLIGILAGIFAAGFFSSRKGDAQPPAAKVVAAPTVSESDNSVERKLAQLKKLHEQGLLTAEEFASKKADILAKL